MSLVLATALDTFVLVVCAILLYRYARLTSAHPGFMYLVFHMMFFTVRMYAVMAGAPTLFTGWRGALPVGLQEIAWAGVLADVGLVSMTVALIICSEKDRRTMAHCSTAAHATGAALSERVIRLVSAVAFPIGIIALMAFSSMPHTENLNVDLGAWNSSSYVIVAQFWPGLVLLALIYFYGFRPILMFLLCIFLALMSIQGGNRFRVLLPVIFLLIVWQTRKGLKWPRKWMVVAFAALTILSFPMKKLGSMVQVGKSTSDIVDVASEEFSLFLRGETDDQKFMDMFASTIWLVDGSGRHFYGTIYYPLLVMPIPRQLWPNKPNLNWYWTEIDSPARPMYRAGMVANMLGEAYANFGPIGIVAVPFVIGYYLGKFYFTAMRKPYLSIYRFSYVIVACSLIQVFRDGLFAVAIFPLVNMMPLTVIVLCSFIVANRKRPSDFRPSSFLSNRARRPARA
jgi:hypothetical protein